MKKYIALMLALCMVVSFAACGKKAEEPAPAEEKKEEDDFDLILKIFGKH